MSVINKMLRDLDRRQFEVAAPGQQAATVQPKVTAGTLAVGHSVAALVAPAPRFSGNLRPVVWVLMVTLVAALGWWFVQRYPAPLAAPNAPQALATVKPAQAQVAAALVTVALAQAPLAAEKSAVAAPAQPASSSAEVLTAVAAPSKTAAPLPVGAVANRVEDTGPIALANGPAVARKSRDTPTHVAAKVAPLRPSPVNAKPVKAASGQLKAETELSPSHVAQQLAMQNALPISRPALPRPAPAAVEPAQLRPVATQEVLAQAQERWRLGERTAAIALLQAAISRLEGAAASQPGTLAALARDYVHMTLAQGQLSAAAAMLARLAQPLADVADIWALRGHVAQRLGQHPEAVQAYLRGLALHPNEPRWMLGAAVSLAAQGQVDPAGDWAAQARQAGPLPPDVANYLAQLGVALPPQ